MVSLGGLVLPRSSVSSRQVAVVRSGNQGCLSLPGRISLNPAGVFLLLTKASLLLVSACPAYKA